MTPRLWAAPRESRLQEQVGGRGHRVLSKLLPAAALARTGLWLQLGCCCPSRNCSCAGPARLLQGLKQRLVCNGAVLTSIRQIRSNSTAGASLWTSACMSFSHANYQFQEIIIATRRIEILEAVVPHLSGVCGLSLS